MSESPKILIADDEEVIRNLLNEHLSIEGFEVVTVSSGEEALEVFRDDPDHLVITDIRMGGMSGVKLLEEVKKVDENAVVVMITSHASLDTAVATLRAGAYEYIYKPFDDLDKVTEIVTRAMEKVTMHRQNIQLMEDLEESNRKIRQSNEELEELAIRDGLTELFNHRHFMEVLEKEVARAARYERTLSLIMLDVDNFKQYNDIHGHPAGDEVLKILADIISTRLRMVDIPCRYGGEEFAILLPETDWEGGRTVAEDIRAQVENYPFAGSGYGHPLKVTVSLGVAELVDGSEEPASLLQRADETLYTAKNGGRNRVVCAKPD